MSGEMVIDTSVVVRLLNGDAAIAQRVVRLPEINILLPP